MEVGQTFKGSIKEAQDEVVAAYDPEYSRSQADLRIYLFIF
jgi:hypothetical protein